MYAAKEAPFQACRAAARFLAAGCDEPLVLEVGSGAGKFSLIGALTTGALFRGVDARVALVSAAAELARRLSTNHANFVIANPLELNWREYTALYFCEPFKGMPNQHSEDFKKASSQLDAMPLQTRVATYGDPGFTFPEGYEPLGEESISDRALRFWLRVGVS